MPNLALNYPGNSNLKMPELIKRQDLSETMLDKTKFFKNNIKFELLNDNTSNISKS